ncbi:M1 family metallopeptidase [Acidobacteriia bacterium AH_259_A11_L15]|nr:M1 family metallopeptidase [Acidobacteriia bacterium AH_259_A11_L15]
MKRAAGWLLVATGTAAFLLFAWAQPEPSSAPPASPILSDTPLSERIVAYEIDVRLDAEAKTLEATEVLTYRNRTGRPLQVFPFHLYLNAFQPDSTFMTETRRDNPSFELEEERHGSIEVTSLEVVGMGELTEQMEFVQPDDGNPNDRTVFQVRLPRAVPPGREVEFRMSFRAQLPEVFARTGYKRDFFMVAQWFPKVGVWWRGEWNCHQFHRNTEFFADFGTYDVRVTLPQGFVVGSTGVEIGRANNPDGTQTLSFHAEDVHDFAWTASPHFEVVDDSFAGSAGLVKIRLLIQPGHLEQAPRYLGALQGTMQHFDRWFGPYPYSQITVVDPPHGGGGAGGMEYPMLITVGTTWWLPEGLRFPELVTEHEFGHQYWYGLVATNEFEDAWLDEGINMYVEAKVMHSLYGRETSVLDLWGLTAGSIWFDRFWYSNLPDTDPMTRSAYQFMSSDAYGTVTYAKTGVVLMTLEGVIGEETLLRALRTYFERYRFRHPTEEDFLRTVEEVAGEDLDWFFDQAIRGTAVLDYRVQSIRSYRVDAGAEGERGGGAADFRAVGETEEEGEAEEPEEGEEALYRSTVVVHRKGDFVFPVEVQIEFGNGETLREHWDGRDRWVRFTYEREARVVAAEIDPDHRVWLDVDQFNNSRTREADRRATRKLANYWLFCTQFFAQLLAWLA